MSSLVAINHKEEQKKISMAEQVKSLITRDLLHLKWDLSQFGKNLIIKPPETYEKDIIKSSMEIKRHEAIKKNKKWIDQNLNSLRASLALGKDVLNSSIIPIIEICETKEQHTLFKMCRYYWSSPYSDYVGRRIKLLIRDAALPNHPIIGITALGSPIIHIPERDKWIGWDKKTRTENLVYAMDAYVLGAVPPYNRLLGGKLISYILASNEVRNIYREKYAGVTTHINKRQANDLVCLFTTSLYGRSSQYNRLKYNDRLLYEEIGKTKGYGSLHLSDETFKSMQEFLRENNIVISNKFGEGPNWRMRVIHTACDLLGINAEILLNHSFKRNIYCVALAKNYKEYLSGTENTIDYIDMPMSSLVNYWKSRWLEKRKKYLFESGELIELINFNPCNFSII